MASSPSSKPENNNGNEEPQWPSQGITTYKIDGVPLTVLEFPWSDDAIDMSGEQSEFMHSFPSPSTLSDEFLTNRGVFDHTFSEPRSGAEVDLASMDPHAAAFVDSIMLMQTPPSSPPVVESVPTQIGHSEAMTSASPLGTQHYYVPDPPVLLIPPPPQLHSSPSLPPSPHSQPITCSQSIPQSTMSSITTPSLSQPQSKTTTMSLLNQTLTFPSDQKIPQSPPPPPPPPSQSQTTTTSLPPPSPSPLTSPQTLTPPSDHTIPSPSPLHLPPPPSDQTIPSPPPPQSNQAITSTPLPPLPPSQSEKPKVISPRLSHPSATTRSPPPASHSTTTPTTGAQATPSAATKSTGEMPAKRKQGRPRKEFAGERSGVEGRVEEASQEKKKMRKKKKNKQGEGEGEGEGKQPAPSFASASPSPSFEGEDKGKQPASSFSSPSPSVLFNHTNSTTLGFSSYQNVIQPASIIASQNEDISSKIISFALNNGAVFVLAASGQLSSLRYMEPSGIVQEPMGLYEILSLSGTLMLSNEGEAPTQRSITGYMTISVVGMDGKIIGGQVCGSMIAASPVQVVGGAIVAATSDGKDSASSKPSSSYHQSEALMLELNKQISSLSQEWQARLVEHKRDIETKANEKEKELRQAKQELEETRQLLNQTRQELQETKLSVSTTQNLLMQLFERLNIVNPPPPPPHSSTNNPPSSL